MIYMESSTLTSPFPPSLAHKNGSSGPESDKNQKISEGLLQTMGKFRNCLAPVEEFREEKQDRLLQMLMLPALSMLRRLFTCCIVKKTTYNSVGVYAVKGSQLHTDEHKITYHNRTLGTPYIRDTELNERLIATYCDYLHTAIRQQENLRQTNPNNRCLKPYSFVHLHWYSTNILRCAFFCTLLFYTSFSSH